jgi:NAD(P)H-dependent flavin oxidoreductase YrpB (nitropropane dioxygenase family)
VAATLDLRNLKTPIVQAGMGFISRHELAAAVSEAGGLGTIAGAGAPIADELAAARTLTKRPVAVNLLLPFVRPGDAEAAADADAVVTFWGEPRRLTAGLWIHQCGSVAEAEQAAAAGADAVIAQGGEAGGHVRGETPVLEFVARVCGAVRIPVLAAGGIVDVGGVRDALAAGATAAVLGTRFLLSDESRAHAEYKRRCLEADETFVTELFGLGWPDAPHRVIANAATRRWLGESSRAPGWIRAANRITAPLATRIPEPLRERAVNVQRPGQPLLSPQPATDDGPDELVDSGPLYAGANVSKIATILPAAEIVRAVLP